MATFKTMNDLAEYLTNEKGLGKEKVSMAFMYAIGDYIELKMTEKSGTGVLIINPKKK